MLMSYVLACQFTYLRGTSHERIPFGACLFLSMPICTDLYLFMLAYKAFLRSGTKVDSFPVSYIRTQIHASCWRLLGLGYSAILAYTHVYIAIPI